MTAIAEARRTVSVVALGNGAHPVGRVAGDGSHLLRGAALGEQPDHLPVAARDRIPGGAIASLQCVKREKWLD